MKDKCCCCKQREHESLFWIGVFVLCLIPIWGWLTLIAIWLMEKCKCAALLIIGAIIASIIWIGGKEISKHNEEAERYDKQRERLEAAWPLK